MKREIDFLTKQTIAKLASLAYQFSKFVGSTSICVIFETRQNFEKSDSEDKNCIITEPEDRTGKNMGKHHWF